MAFPILVKSVHHWFRREFPDIPLDSVHFAEGCSVDQTQLNPYKARVIVVHSLAKHGLYKVLGFIEYGSDHIVYEVPPPLPIVSPPNPLQSITMDDIRAYIHADYPTPNPAIDLLLLAVGRFDWHYVETIPLEYLEQAGIPLPPVCSNANLIDYQTYYANGKPEPRLWFDVDLSKVPNKLARSLPLHPKGKLHIADSDIWQVVVRKATPEEIQGTQLEFILLMTKERISSTKRRRLRHVKVIDSREEVESLAPPCFRHILSKNRFPVDHERQQLVRTWAKAGVTLKVVGEMLDNLNTKYPKHVTSSTQRRWDYISHYNRGYAPPSCEKMECPLAPGQPMDVKKSVCFKEFMERFPNKKAYTKGFYGPIKWFEW